MRGLILSYLQQQPIYDQPPKQAPPPLIQKAVPKPPPAVEPSPPSEMESLFEKIAPDLLIEPQILILWQEEEEAAFFEKVAAAVSQSVAPARCQRYCQEQPIDAHVILARAPLLQIGYHELAREPLRIGLYPASSYEKSIELKRELWKTLKSIKSLLA